jgi:hypothetical protein
LESFLTRPRRRRSAATAFGVLLASLLVAVQARAATISYHFDGNDPPAVKLQTAGIDFAGFRVASGGALTAKVSGPGVLRLLVFADCERDKCPGSLRLMISVDGYGKLHELTPQFEPEAGYVPAVPLVPSAPMPVLLKLDAGEHTFQARMPGGFSGSAVLSFSNAKRVTGSDDLDLGLDIELPPPAPAPVAAKPAPKPAVAALDLDLDLPPAPPVKSAGAVKKQAPAALDLDLDLPPTAPVKPAKAASKKPAVDLDLDLDLPPTAPTKPSKTASKAPAVDLDLDLELPSAPAPAAAPVAPKTVITVKRTDGPTAARAVAGTNVAGPRPTPVPVKPAPATPPPAMSLLIPLDDEPEPAPAPKPAAPKPAAPKPTAQRPEPKPVAPVVAVADQLPAPKPPEPEKPPPELGRVELGLRGGWNWSRDRLEGQGEAVLELGVRLPQPTLRVVVSGGTTLLRGTWVAFEPGRGRGDFVQNTMLVPVNVGLTWEPTGKGGISPFVGLSLATGYAETTLSRLSLSPVVVKGLMLGGTASAGVRLQAGRGSFVFMGEHTEAVATLATLSKLGQSVVSRTSVTGGYLFSF